MYLLDTMIISELRRQRPHGAVLAWLAHFQQKCSRGFVPENAPIQSSRVSDPTKSGSDFVDDTLAGVDDADLRLSAVTLGEIQSGIEMTRKQNPSRADALEAWLDAVAASWNVLPMDGGVFRLWAKLMHGRSDDLIEDAMIAATARVHNLILVTRNVRDFKTFGVKTLDPFKPA